MIQVIHNPLRTDRQRILEEELLSQRLWGKVNIMPAVTQYRNPVRNISIAHKNCVRAAMAAGVDRVIIMEDDVKFMCRRSFGRFLELSMTLPPDWDIFLAGVYNADMQPYSPYVASVTRFAGLHCYMVNSQYYEYMLGASEEINLDKWMSTPGYGSSNAYLAHPMLALQHDGFSDNVRKQTDYNKQIARRYMLWNCQEP